MLDSLSNTAAQNRVYAGYLRRRLPVLVPGGLGVADRDLRRVGGESGGGSGGGGNGGGGRTAAWRTFR